MFQNVIIKAIQLMSLKDWQEDLLELKVLVETVKRPENLKFIQQQIKLVQTKIEKAMAELPVKVEIKPEVKPQVKKEATTQIVVDNFITITKYSYDQEGSKVKIYLPLEDVGKECKDEQVKVTFSKEALEVKILGYKGHNYSYAVRRLNGPIRVEECKYSIKNNNIILTLVKAQAKHWDGLNYKDKKPESDFAPDKSKDPQAGLMDLMKKMYEQGDDNMKRTIAETWSKSQNKMM